MTKVNLEEKFGLFSEQWSPRIVGERGGQQVKLVKLQGEFVWHSHEHEDELFYVVRGAPRMQFRDRSEIVRPGEFIVVPRSVEHCPDADEETWVMLFEPAGTVNTGAAGGERTVTDLPSI